MKVIPNIPHHLILGLLAAGLVAGCSSSPKGSDSLSTQSIQNQQIIALINGSPITQSDIMPDLAERIGKQALLDLILDRQLEREVQRLHLTITRGDIDHEESLFVRTIEAQSRQALGYQLLDSLRSAKRLGPNRYPRLLRRSAILRKLAINTAAPNEQEYILAERIAFGPTYRVRLFVAETQTQVNTLRQSLLNSPSGAQRWMFADACTTDSIHPSASRGGLIPSLSTADPMYPTAISDAIGSTPIGTVSGILSNDAGFALVLVEAVNESTKPTPEQTKSIREQLANRKQSLEMQRLAEQLVRDADVIVMDRALNWAWNNQS